MAATLEEDFQGDLVRIVTFAPIDALEGVAWYQSIPAGDPRLAPFRDAIADGEPICGRLHPDKHALLYGMRAEDVPPTRLAAAKEAAKAFVAAQRDTTRIGIVEFSGEASLALAPTTDREALAAAIDALHTRDATAIGDAILVSLKALFPAEAFELSEARDTLYEPPPRTGAAVAPGSHKAAAVPTTSGSEARFEATTAVPQAMASSAGSPKPSSSEGITNNSAPL